MKIWAVNVTVCISHGPGHVSIKELPTFYLNGDVQGFTDAVGCESVVRDILPKLADRAYSIHCEPLGAYRA